MSFERLKVARRRASEHAFLSMLLLHFRPVYHSAFLSFPSHRFLFPSCPVRALPRRTVKRPEKCGKTRKSDCLRGRRTSERRNWTKRRGWGAERKKEAWTKGNKRKGKKNRKKGGGKKSRWRKNTEALETEKERNSKDIPPRFSA